MKIRKVTVNDLDEIDKIYSEGVIDEVKSQFLEKKRSEIIKDLNKNKKDRINGFKKDINSKLNCWVILEDNNLTVGFGQAVINFPDKKKAMIEKIYISKNYRKKGFASKIMKELLNWLKKKKVKSVSCGIFIKNTPSIKLNEKFGFKITAVRMQKII